MPTTPQITLTATLQNLSGTAAGTAANPAKLVIVLCGYGLTLPQIAGTSTIAKKKYTLLAPSGTPVSVLLWGNDVITPVGVTFYSITVIDGEGNVVQTANYQLVGSGTFDLSNLVPYDPLPPVPPATGDTLFFDDVPVGTIDGTNAVFTLTETPSPRSSLNLFKNGSRMTDGTAFSISANVITYTSDYIPFPGDTQIAASYIYASATPTEGEWVFDDVPMGTIDGTNAVFTLSETPVPATSLNFFKNGTRLTEGVAYTLSGRTITYEADYIPQPGDSHIAGSYLT